MNYIKDPFWYDLDYCAADCRYARKSRHRETNNAYQLGLGLMTLRGIVHVVYIGQ